MEVESMNEDEAQFLEKVKEEVGLELLGPDTPQAWNAKVGAGYGGPIHGPDCQCDPRFIHIELHFLDREPFAFTVGIETPLGMAILSDQLGDACGEQLRSLNL